MDTLNKLFKGNETVALRLDSCCNISTGYAHINLDVVYVDDEQNNNQHDGIAFYRNYYDEKHQYKDLKITCQMDSKTELPYGWELVVGNISDLSLSEAESVIKTLRPIHRKLAKIADQEGPVLSLEDFAIRVSRVLKVKAFYSRKKTRFNPDGKLTINKNIGSLRAQIETRIEDIQTELGFTKAA